MEHEFYNEESARPATGRTDAQGSFYLTSFDDNDGALPGQHVVVVTKTDSEDEAGTDVSLSMDEALVAPRPKKSKIKQLLPTRYGTPDTSPLRVKVSADKTNEPTISLSP